MSPKPTLHLILVLALALLSFQCHPGASGGPPKQPEPPANGPVPTYGYQIVNIYPHDSNAFTQGLILMDGTLLESTGEEGHSSLRRVELETGKVLKKVDVPLPYFAEGIAVLNGTRSAQQCLPRSKAEARRLFSGLCRSRVRRGAGLNDLPHRCFPAVFRPLGLVPA